MWQKPNTRISRGGDTIGPVISLKEAARVLDRDRRYIKGLAHGLGIEFHMIGNASALTREDIERLRREIQRHQTLEAACR